MDARPRRCGAAPRAKPEHGIEQLVTYPFIATFGPAFPGSAEALSAVCPAHWQGNGPLNRPSRNLPMSRSQARPSQGAMADSGSAGPATTASRATTTDRAAAAPHAVSRRAAPSSAPTARLLPRGNAAARAARPRILARGSAADRSQTQSEHSRTLQSPGDLSYGLRPNQAANDRSTRNQLSLTTWIYGPGDAHATVEGADFTDGGIKGMKVGDLVFVIEAAAGGTTAHSVTAVAAANNNNALLPGFNPPGAATISAGQFA